jgi:hypothetical protein
MGEHGTIAHQLDYQLRVNAILLKETRGPSVPGPMLSPDEMDELREAYAWGEAPEVFAKRLVSRDEVQRDRQVERRLEDGPAPRISEREAEHLTNAGRGHLLRLV